MKIRIFALAKELDLDSKLLIDYCAKCGVQAKNVLASISPEERDQVVAYIRQLPKGSAGADVKPPVITREETIPEAAKMTRPIRNMATMFARPQPGRPRPAESPAAPAEPEEAAEESPSTEVPVVAPAITAPAPAPVAEPVPPVKAEAPKVEPTTAAPQRPSGSRFDTGRVNRGPVATIPSRRPTAPSATPPAAEPSAGPGGATKSPPVPPSTTAQLTEPVREIPAPPMEPNPGASDAEKLPETPPTIVAEGAPVAAPPAAPDKSGSLQRSDYVSATGTARPLRVMTAMTARGTSDTTGSRQIDRGKPPPLAGRRQGPQIAAIPEFKGPPPKAAKADEKAQKPDIKLTPNEIRSDSPLAAHLKKNAEKQKRRVDEPVGDAKKEGARGKAGERLAGMGLEGNRSRRTKRPANAGEEEGDGRNRIVRRPKNQRRGSQQFKSEAEVELPLTIRTLSEAMGRPAKAIIQILFARGDMVTINTPLTEEEALEIALELGVELTIKKEKDVEDELKEIFEEPDAPETLVTRPPIITILGHVDHGKTTLVDKIRSANVAASEHGGITQHIAAYQVQHNDHKLTFVDTPGHAAFGEMRARGADVTDIVVLVVAANDGVMPQTVECIAHARAAGVPLVVALNKIDLPDVNEQRVLQDLAANNVLAAEWGGDVEVVRTSGLTGKGVSDLLDTLLLTAELHELKANFARPACGVCLEAFRDEHRGPVAWLVDQKGTLRVGDVILCGQAYGRVRAMYNERDEELEEAPPSTPVKVAGLDIVPRAGDRFLAVDDIDLVREIAEARRETGRADYLASRTTKLTLEDILNRKKDGGPQDLFLIVKSDTPGSMEALKHEISKFEHPEVRVKVIHEGIGGVNESDIYLAAASKAVIVAFHVVPEDRAEQLAQAEGVDVRRYNIIYEVIDDIRNTLEGMLRPEQREVVTGRAIVLRLFAISRFGTIAGCRVLNGTIERSHRIHLIREQKLLNSYGIGSLRREKDDVREVREGMECGIRLEGYNDVKEGDLFEAYKIEEVRRTLE